MFNVHYETCVRYICFQALKNVKTIPAITLFIFYVITAISYHSLIYYELRDLIFRYIMHAFQNISILSIFGRFYILLFAIIFTFCIVHAVHNTFFSEKSCCVFLFVLVLFSFTVKFLAIFYANVSSLITLHNIQSRQRVAYHYVVLL